MTGQFQGVITELEKKAEYPVYRTWCGLYQLDLVMQAEYKNLSVLDKSFVTLTVQYIGHLRQQYKLITEMRSTCPKLANRWVVMGNVCDWFLQHRVRLLQFAWENANTATVVENGEYSTALLMDHSCCYGCYYKCHKYHLCEITK